MATSSRRSTDDAGPMWLILRERMKGGEDDFYIGTTTTAEIRQKGGITLSACLKLAKVTGQPSDYAFHIHSKSMAAAVRLLNDESIKVTHDLYCKNDPIVTIHIRDAKDASPNTSQCPSYHKSLKARKDKSRGRLVPELFVAPQPGHVKGSSDVATMDGIDESDMVTLVLGRDDRVTLSKDYVLGWIESQVSDGKSLTEVTVESIGPDGHSRKSTLTSDIWQRSLLRGSHSPDFLALWDKYNRVVSDRRNLLGECLELDPEFSIMCERFTADLRVYDSDKKARERLDRTGHEFYLGKPYFGSTVVQKLLSLPTTNGTLEKDLRSLATKRMENGSFCAAHDLFPLYRTMLLVGWNKDTRKTHAEHRDLPVRSQTAPRQPAQKKKGKAKSLLDTVRGFGSSKGDKGGPSS